jgi:hypothetical protein
MRLVFAPVIGLGVVAALVAAAVEGLRPIVVVGVSMTGFGVIVEVPARVEFGIVAEVAVRVVRTRSTIEIAIAMSATAVVAIVRAIRAVESIGTLGIIRTIKTIGMLEAVGTAEAVAPP